MARFRRATKDWQHVVLGVKEPGWWRSGEAVDTAGAIGLILQRSEGPDINLDLNLDEAAMLQRALARALPTAQQKNEKKEP